MTGPSSTVSKKVRPRADAGLLLACSLVLLPQTALGTPANPPSSQTDAPSPGASGLPGDELHLSLSLNGNPQGLVVFGWHDNTLWGSADTLRRLGVVLPPDETGAIQLSSLEGVAASYDAASQSLAITATPQALQQPLSVLDTDAVPAPQASADPGLLLNYDLYATQGRQGAWGVNAFAEMRAFSGRDVLSNTLMIRAHRDGTGGWKNDPVRLDTTWSRSYPEKMLTLRVGDAITGALPWSRAMRIGGIQISRNFALQPYRVTTPLPDFIGSASLPSQVELFINGVRQYTGQVPSGPFRLNKAPSISGTGNAQVVLTDAFGRATTLNFSIYDSQRLLQAGLSDWSAELGWVRRNYGLRSFDYGGSPLVSGVWRRGMTNRLTLEAHGHTTSGLVNAGVGAVWQLGAAGVVSGAVAHSSHGGQRGTLLNLGYSWQNNRFSFGVDGSRSTAGYRDAAALHGGATTRGSGRVSVSYNAGVLGNLSLSYMYLRQARHGAPMGLPDQDTNRLTSLYWSRPIGRSAFLSVSLNQSHDRQRTRSLFVGLSWSLDGRISASTSAQHDREGDTYTASAQRSAPSEGGFGWRAGLRDAPHHRGAEAHLDYLGRYGRVNTGLDVQGDNRNIYAGATGAVVFMGGHAFPTRQIYDGFAVVSTDGVAAVPVQLENRPMGRTDANGVLLVSPLNAYQLNRVSINPMNLPANVRVDAVQVEATPTDRAGTRIRFGITPVRAAALILVDEAGTPLPLGSTAQLRAPGNGQTIVGHDGAAYLDTLNDDNVLEVQTPQGRCQTRFAYPSQGDSAALVPQIGPLRCVASREASP